MNLIAATLFLLTMNTVHASEPKEIIFSCKSKVIGNYSYQIYGDLVDDGIKLDKYIAIDTQNPDAKPIIQENIKWEIDDTYKPTEKYKDYNRFIIQENNSDQLGLQLIIPKKSKVYELAKEEAESKGDDMVQGNFEAVLRTVNNWSDGGAGQEYLSCGTGWLNF